MTDEEIRKKNQEDEEFRQKMRDAAYASREYFGDKTAPFSDYLADPKGKFAIAITKKQYVFNADPYRSHDSLGIELIKTIRPDLETDSWGNAYNPKQDFRNRNVIMYGYPHYLLINLPSLELLSIDQYEEIKKMCLEIRDYNEKVRETHNGEEWELLIGDSNLIHIEGTKYPHTSEAIDSIVSQLEKYITDDLTDSNEVIIGRELSKNKSL